MRKPGFAKQVWFVKAAPTVQCTHILMYNINKPVCSEESLLWRGLISYLVCLCTLMKPETNVKCISLA